MDQVIHFYGFGVAAIVVHQLLACRMPERVSGAMLIFLAWIGSMGLGTFNEVVEFLAFVSLDETGVGDIYNTGLDLCFNLAGAVTGASKVRESPVDCRLVCWLLISKPAILAILSSLAVVFNSVSEEVVLSLSKL